MKRTRSCQDHKDGPSLLKHGPRDTQTALVEGEWKDCIGSAAPIPKTAVIGVATSWESWVTRLWSETIKRYIQMRDNVPWDYATHHLKHRLVRCHPGLRAQVRCTYHYVPWCATDVELYLLNLCC